MKYHALLPLLLPTLAAAFPGMANVKEEILEQSKREALAQPVPQPEPQLGGILGALGDDVAGLVGSVVASVNPNNKRPEPGYEFRAPGPGDSRGPCPGLNLLANYGYLPRNGYVSAGQVLEATSRGFNMGADLALVLIVFAVVTDGDLATESWWLGADPSNNLGGLNRHSTVEADISPNREDFYNGCGDDHSLSSRLFKQNVEIVKNRDTKQFDLEAMAQHYAKSADFSKANNRYLYFFPFPLIVSVAAFAFYPNFFSNGTYGAGGVANYDSISTIVGAKYDKQKDAFEYVPERWPENWYRRDTPYDAVTALTQGILNIYARNLVFPGASTLFTKNFNAQSLLCDVYQGLNSITPLALSGDEAGAEEIVTWAVSKLDSVFDRTVLGCPGNAISNNSPSLLFPNASSPGGPLDVPSSQQKNRGNNVYNKFYFKDAPINPNCNPTF